jgi:hypothetical protein
MKHKHTKWKRVKWLGHVIKLDKIEGGSNIFESNAESRKKWKGQAWVERCRGRFRTVLSEETEVKISNRNEYLSCKELRYSKDCRVKE